MSYFKNISTTGAVSKTPRRILRAISSESAAFASQKILEIGAGRGEITDEIVGLPSFAVANFTAVELNSEYCHMLRDKYPLLSVKNGNAVNFPELVNGKQDLIVSSIPFSFLPPDNRKLLVSTIKDQLNPGGKAIILFHAAWLIPMLKKQLTGSRIKIFWHLPPYFLLIFQKSER